MATDVRPLEIVLRKLAGVWSKLNQKKKEDRATVGFFFNSRA
jgi:hypothetical protein